jgi:hypothetical protein
MTEINYSEIVFTPIECKGIFGGQDYIIAIKYNDRIIETPYHVDFLVDLTLVHGNVKAEEIYRVAIIQAMAEEGVTVIDDDPDTNNYMTATYSVADQIAAQLGYQQLIKKD